MKARYASWLAVIGMLNALPASAEVVQCNGVWVNHECEGQVSETLKERVITQTPEEMEKSRKRSLLHEVTMKSIRAREDYDIRSDVATLQALCDNPSTTIEECKAEIAKFEKALDRKILKESEVADDRRRRKEREEREKIAKTQAESGTTNIAIVQNNIYRGGLSGNFGAHPRPYPGTSPANGAGNSQGNSGAGVIDSHGFYVPKPPVEGDGRFHPEWK